MSQLSSILLVMCELRGICGSLHCFSPDGSPTDELRVKVQSLAVCVHPAQFGGQVVLRPPPCLVMVRAWGYRGGGQRESVLVVLPPLPPSAGLEEVRVWAGLPVPQLELKHLLALPGLAGDGAQTLDPEGQVTRAGRLLRGWRSSSPATRYTLVFLPPWAVTPSSPCARGPAPTPRSRAWWGHRPGDRPRVRGCLPPHSTTHTSEGERQHTLL